MSDVESEIAEIRRAFERAENEGDPSVQIGRRDPEDFVRMPPGRPPMGYEEANTELESLYATTDIAVQWESDGVLSSGDLAVDSGTFTVELPDEGTRRDGSWLMVYRRDTDGDWKVVRDIYNWDDKPE